MGFGDKFALQNPELRTSDMGQTETSTRARATSALPPIATKQRTSRDVSNVPEVAVSNAATTLLFDHLVGGGEQLLWKARQ